MRRYSFWKTSVRRGTDAESGCKRMSVVGIDFGSQSTRIAVVRAGGVDVICNEVSDRMTPSMVSYDAKRRFTGDMSRTLLVGNMRNTVCALPRVIGRSHSELSALENSLSPCALVPVGDSASVGAAVSYRGEDRVFSDVELAGFFLNRVRAIAHAETGAAVNDIVVSAPSHWGDRERCALRDAAEVAGMRILRVINTSTAAATVYGITKTDIPAETPRMVAIVDLGHSALDACLVAVAAGRAEVLAHASDAHVGGRDFDEALAQHHVADIRSRRGVDVAANRKAMLRLRTACERVKKVLSSIQNTRVELEALVDGADFAIEATRPQLEELCAPLLERIEAALQPLIAALPPGRSFDAVEIIGGATRIPAVKALLARVFGVEAVSTTLNADEAVARGAAIACAMESPSVRVREFRVVDIATRGVRIVWRGPAGDELGAVDAFPAGSRLGEARVLHAPSAVLPVTLEARSVLDGALRASFEVLPATKMDVPANSSGARVVVRALVDASSLVDVLSAAVEVDVTETVPAGEGEEAQTRTVTRSLPLKVRTVRAHTLPRDALKRLRDVEETMAANDKLVAETDDARNAVEETIYALRGRIDDGAYDEVAREDERSAARAALTSAEEWLYDDGADVEKAAYVAKRSALEALVQPWAERIAQAAREKRAALAAATTDQQPAVEVPAMDMD